MGNNVVIPNRIAFEDMETIQLDSTVWTLLQQENVVFKDDVLTPSDLPLSGNSVDDFRLVRSNGYVYKWNGSNRVFPTTGGTGDSLRELLGSDGITPKNSKNVYMNDMFIYFRGEDDHNHGIGWDYTENNFDGPNIRGVDGTAFSVIDESENKVMAGYFGIVDFEINFGSIVGLGYKIYNTALDDFPILAGSFDIGSIMPGAKFSTIKLEVDEANASFGSFMVMADGEQLVEMGQGGINLGSDGSIVGSGIAGGALQRYGDAGNISWRLEANWYIGEESLNEASPNIYMRAGLGGGANFYISDNNGDKVFNVEQSYNVSQSAVVINEQNPESGYIGADIIIRADSTNSDSSARYGIFSILETGSFNSLLYYGTQGGDGMLFNLGYSGIPNGITTNIYLNESSSGAKGGMEFRNSSGGVMLNIGMEGFTKFLNEFGFVYAQNTVPFAQYMFDSSNYLWYEMKEANQYQALVKNIRSASLNYAGRYEWLFPGTTPSDGGSVEAMASLQGILTHQANVGATLNAGIFGKISPSNTATHSSAGIFYVDNATGNSTVAGLRVYNVSNIHNLPYGVFVDSLTSPNVTIGFYATDNVETGMDVSNVITTGIQLGGKPIIGTQTDRYMANNGGVREFHNKEGVAVALFKRIEDTLGGTLIRLEHNRGGITPGQVGDNIGIDRTMKGGGGTELNYARDIVSIVDNTTGSEISRRRFFLYNGAGSGETEAYNMTIDAFETLGRNVALSSGNYMGLVNTNQLGFVSNTGINLRSNNVNVNVGSTTDAGKVGGRLSNVYTSTGNVGTGVDVLKTYTLNSGFLTINGASLKIKASGTFGATANAKEVFFYLNGTGGTELFASGSAVTNDGAWSMELNITRLDATNARISVSFNSNNSSYTGASYIETTLNNFDTTPNTFDVCGEGTDDDDIVCTMMSVDYYNI